MTFPDHENSDRTMKAMKTPESSTEVKSEQEIISKMRSKYEYKLRSTKMEVDED